MLDPEILEAIDRALAEDIGPGDATTNSIVQSDAQMRGVILAKQPGIVAGLDVASAVFAALDPGVDFQPLLEEGARVRAGDHLARVAGTARALLTGERTALDFLGRMSGIATLTRQFVDAVGGTGAVILDTRKTAPGLRMVDKLAVRRGGGQNHRRGLFDMILIKDNHIDFAGGLEQAVKRARSATSGLAIEVEARTLEDVVEALRLGVDRILLDNMHVTTMREAVQRTAKRAKLEASGNVRLDNVREIAETGVDYISVGALTHSAPTLDISFDYIRQDSPAVEVTEKQ
jgi:nicotinate-nucleotide pyrophosphorylase (carboxylating)